MNKNLNIEHIIELQKYKTQKEIGDMFNVSCSTIGKILRKNGIKSVKSRLNLSRLKLDIDYFDNIDEPKKAYWLGFLSADGCLKNNKVTLYLADKDHVEKFKYDLKSEHAVTVTNHLDKRTGKIYTGYGIQITNKLFNTKLRRYISVDKSNNFSIPEINKELLPHFLAGIMDGDGSFSIKTKSNYLTCNLISTKECLSQIQNYLFENLGIDKTKLIRVTENQSNVWVLYIYNGALAFSNHIYCLEDKIVYLKRKVEKLEKIKQHLKENPNKKGFRRRPIKVFDKKGIEIKTFESTKDCVDYYKISTATLFNRLKSGKLYKDLVFIGQEIIKY